MPASILDFEIDRAALRYAGAGLQRPECILAEPDGSLWIADARGGVVELQPDGRQRIITQRHSEHFAGVDSEASRYLQGTLPNGLAFAENGDILIANFGTDRLEAMTRDGESRVLADHIDGQPDRQSEFRSARFQRPHLDHRLHAHQELDACAAPRPSRRLHRALYRRHIPHRGRKDSISPMKFAWTRAKSIMYVAETTGGCISRLRVNADGSLGKREVFGPSSLGKGAWPDGIAFDSGGNLWGTMVYSDKLFVLSPQGDLRVLLDEGDPRKVAALEKAFFKKRSTRKFSSPRDRASRRGWPA